MRRAGLQCLAVLVLLFGPKMAAAGEGIVQPRASVLFGITNVVTADIALDVASLVRIGWTVGLSGPAAVKGPALGFRLATFGGSHRLIAVGGLEFDKFSFRDEEGTFEDPGWRSWSALRYEFDLVGSWFVTGAAGGEFYPGGAIAPLARAGLGFSF